MDIDSYRQFDFADPRSRMVQLAEKSSNGFGLLIARAGLIFRGAPAPPAIPVRFGTISSCSRAS